MTEVPADDRRSVRRNVMTFVNLNEDDHLVVQCNATNKHGYIWANAYLNVLCKYIPLTLSKWITHYYNMLRI